MSDGSGGRSVVPLALLVVRSGHGVGDEHVVGKPVVTIGKASQSDVVLPDDSVSARHARLEYESGGWRVTDLGSTNGTYLAGARLAPEVATPVDYDARIRFGGVELELRPAEGADLEAARAAYRPEAPAAPARSGGFRLPLWVFVLILVIVALVIAYFGWIRSEAPAEPATVPTTAAAPQVLAPVVAANPS